MARAAAGLSLRDLEVQIGRRVTAQAISKYERDEAVPGSGVPIALADALHVSVDHLAGDPELVLDSVEWPNALRGCVVSMREATAAIRWSGTGRAWGCRGTNGERMLPFQPHSAIAVRAAIDGLKEFQRAHRLDGLSVRQMIEEGRRY